MSVLIKNGIVVTLGEGADFIKDGAVYVEDDRIVDIGRTENIVGKYRPEQIIDASWKVVMPGMVNAHNHTDGDTLSRGFGIDMMVALDYFKNFKWPRILQMKPDDYYVGALSGYVEQIRTGCTTIADNYYGPKGVDTSGVPKAAIEAGMRSVLVRGYHDVALWMPEEFMEDPDHVVQQYRRLYEEWDGKGDGRVKAWIGPVNLVYNSEESLLKLKDLADETGMGFHSHVAEDKRTTDEIKKRFGKGYIDVFHHLGVLGPRFQAAHSIYVSDGEIQLMAKTGATAVHNAAGNMIMCAGVAPVVKMKEAGVNVALGSDTKMEMFSAMKFAACLQKLTNMNPMALTARDVLRMATINGARAYGMEDEIGSLKVGKKADIAIVDLRKSYAAPYMDPIIALVYYLHGGDVDTVLVDGKIVMEGKVVKTVDEAQVVEKVQEAAVNLTSRMSNSNR